MTPATSRLTLFLAALTATLAGSAAPALAAPACTGYTQAPKTLISGRGTLESAIVDRKGRFTNVEVYAKPGPADIAAGLDGMARDKAGACTSPTTAPQPLRRQLRRRADRAAEGALRGAAAA